MPPAKLLAPKPVLLCVEPKTESTSTRRPAERNRHSIQEWENLKQTISQLFIHDNRTAAQVLEILRNDHRFKTSLRALKEKLGEWEMNKNFKKSDMEVLLAKRNQRKSVGKDTVFFYWGQELSEARFNNFANRSFVRDTTAPSSNAPTPPGVAYHTPASEILGMTNTPEEVCSSSMITNPSELCFRSTVKHSRSADQANQFFNGLNKRRRIESSVGLIATPDSPASLFSSRLLHSLY
ncbi:hypothetical protein GQ53DRAFT_835505, partial [Thozetella sp. PMI_491]